MVLLLILYSHFLYSTHAVIDTVLPSTTLMWGVSCYFYILWPSAPHIRPKESKSDLLRTLCQTLKIIHWCTINGKMQSLPFLLRSKRGILWEQFVSILQVLVKQTEKSKEKYSSKIFTVLTKQVILFNFSNHLN